MPTPRSVISSAKLIAVCTLFSRVTGLARDVLVGQAFGLSWIQDAFSYAFQFPNLFRRLFGEGALAPVFVPVFMRTLERDGRDGAWRLLARTLALLSAALLALIVLIELVLAAFWHFAPADPAKAEARRLLVGLTALMLPFMLTVCVLALLSSMLNCLHSFAPAAIAPALLNVGMIVAVLWIAPRLYPGELRGQVYVLAASVVVAGVLQLVFLWPALRASGVQLGWRFEPRDPAVREMLRLLPPVALGQGVLAFGVFLDSQICVLLTHARGAPETVAVAGLFSLRYPLEEGALGALSYAQRLYQFPLGVLAISLATAALPAFSRLAIAQDWHAWGGEVRRTVRVAVFEGVLAGALTVVLAEPIVRLLFEYGRFTADDVTRTARILAWYGLGLWAFCAQHMVLRGFYSLGDVRTPLAISAAVLPLNVAITLALVWIGPIRESAFAISSCVTSGLAVVYGLILLERRTRAALLDRDTLIAFGKTAACGVLSAAGAYAALRAVPAEWLSALPGVLLRRSAMALAPLALGVVVFLALARLSRLPEVGWLLARSRPPRPPS